MKTRFTAEILALAGLAAGLAVTSGCKTTYSDNGDLSLRPMPAALEPEPTGNITYATPESEKPQPYYITHPEAVAALDKVAAKAPAAQTAAPGYSTYVVKPGESLSKIANAHGFRYVDVLAVNPGIDPNKIRVGQTIILPAAGTAKQIKATSGTNAKKVASAAGGTYVVQKGDILGRIAKKYGVKLADLKKANGLTSDKIVVGQKLVIPGAQSSAKPSQAVAQTKPSQAAQTKPLQSVAPAKQQKVAESAPTSSVVPPPPSVPEQNVQAPVIQEKAPVEPIDIVPPQVPEVQVPPPEVNAQPAPVENNVANPPKDSPKTTSYVVQEGQDLFDISVQWGVSAADIKKLNNLDSDTLTPGRTILIPQAQTE